VCVEASVFTLLLGNPADRDRFYFKERPIDSIASISDLIQPIDDARSGFY
jgi:hypothetical protein